MELITTLTHFLLWLCLLLTARGEPLEDPERLPCQEGASAGCRVQHRARRQAEIEVRSTTLSQSHRLPCRRSERRKTACLNHGRCFVLDMAGDRHAACHCPAKFEGPRCEQLSIYYILTYGAHLSKGLIIGGVVIFIIIVITCASMYCSYRKGKRKKKQSNAERPDDESKRMVPNGESLV